MDECPMFQCGAWNQWGGMSGASKLKNRKNARAPPNLPEAQAACPGETAIFVEHSAKLIPWGCY